MSIKRSIPKMKVEELNPIVLWWAGASLYCAYAATTTKNNYKYSIPIKYTAKSQQWKITPIYFSSFIYMVHAFSFSWFCLTMALNDEVSNEYLASHFPKSTCGLGRL